MSSNALENWFSNFSKSVFNSFFCKEIFQRSLRDKFSKSFRFNVVPGFKSLNCLSILWPLSKSIALCLMFLLSISSSTFLSSWTNSISALSIAIDLSSFSIPCLLNTLTSITTPVLPDGNFKDESLTSVAFSPKIERNNFSSGLDDVSLLGVTLPTKISAGFTSAPTYTTPDSSRFLKLSSLTFGMSLVISSAPSFVSLAIDSYSSIWTDVKTSSVTHLSEIRIESSKL